MQGALISFKKLHSVTDDDGEKYWGVARREPVDGANRPLPHQEIHPQVAG